MTTKDILFWETDNSCAYCGIRGAKNLTIHHIDGNDQNNRYDNRIVLCRDCHDRADPKENIPQERIIPEEKIREIKKVLICKTLTPHGVSALKRACRGGLVVMQPDFLYTLVELGYMDEKEILRDYTDDDKFTIIEARFEITEEGENLYYSWFK